MTQENTQENIKRNSKDLNIEEIVNSTNPNDNLDNFIEQKIYQDKVTNSSKEEYVSMYSSQLDDKNLDNINNLNKAKKHKNNDLGGLIMFFILSLMVGIGTRFFIKNIVSKNSEKIEETVLTGTQVVIIDNKNNKDTDDKNDKDINDNSNEQIDDKKNFELLGKGYYKDKNNVYYSGEIMKNVEIEKFKVIQYTGNYILSGILVNSHNLLDHLKDKINREFLMTTMASITNKNINVKNELTTASIHSMNSFKSEFDNLNKLNWGDEMTDLERAKFGIIFLYIKLIKNYENDQIRMSKAKEELKYFVNNTDKILKNYSIEKNKAGSLTGDIGYDEYCIYNNGELYACFLNEIFISKK